MMNFSPMRNRNNDTCFKNNIFNFSKKDQNYTEKILEKKINDYEKKKKNSNRVSYCIIP